MRAPRTARARPAPVHPSTFEVMMPKSKVRKKSVYTPPPDRRTPVKPAAAPSNPIFVGVMLGMFVLGIAWIVVYYLAPGVPVLSDLGAWNFAIGFGLFVIGLLMTMRWR